MNKNPQTNYNEGDLNRPTINQQVQLQLLTYIQTVMPQDLITQLHQVAHFISYEQHQTLENMKKVVQPLRCLTYQSNHETYLFLHRRIKGVHQRNFQLMKAVLDLRTKVLSRLYFASQKSERRSGEEYELAKRSLFEAKNGSERRLYELKSALIINQNKEAPQTSREQKKPVRLEMNYTQRGQISKAMETLVQECGKCRLQLQLLQDFMRISKRKQRN